MRARNPAVALVALLALLASGAGRGHAGRRRSPAGLTRLAADIQTSGGSATVDYPRPPAGPASTR